MKILGKEVHFIMDQASTSHDGNSFIHLCPKNFDFESTSWVEMEVEVG